MTTPSPPTAQVALVAIPIGAAELVGRLVLPPTPQGLVLFAHGSGSSRQSPRNRYVSNVLQAAGLGTLLFDLLTVEEAQLDAQTRQLRFDIGLLATRLQQATDWVQQQPLTASLPLGYFGASTGSAAALQAAADRPNVVRAIVSRGGRPDLAQAVLSQVQAPTLLIVGGADTPVIPLNRQAYDALHTEKKMVLVPGATHLFSEAGALEQVAMLARQWFLQFLPRSRDRAS